LARILPAPATALPWDTLRRLSGALSEGRRPESCPKGARVDDSDRPTTTDLRLREFTMADYEAVDELWRRAGLWMRPSDGRDQVALKLERDPDLFLVACADEGLVGVAMGGWDGRRAYIYHLAVDPRWQRRGVAGRLLDCLEARFRAKGALKAKLQIVAGNDVSAAFFAARGYALEADILPWGRELVAGGAPDDRSPDGGAPDQAHDRKR
jgi:GNAT superfamily N-acetyltransferase